MKWKPCDDEIWDYTIIGIFKIPFRTLSQNAGDEEQPRIIEVRKPKFTDPQLPKSERNNLNSRWWWFSMVRYWTTYYPALCNQSQWEISSAKPFWIVTTEVLARGHSVLKIPKMESCGFQVQKVDIPFQRTCFSSVF